MNRTIVRLAVAAATAVVLAGQGMPAQAAAPKPVRHPNCAALNKVYKHGVAKRNARDKVRSGRPVTTFTVDPAAYAKNTHLDRDKDGVACEKR